MIRKGLVFCLVLLLFAGTAWAATDVVRLTPEKSATQRGPVYGTDYLPEDLILLTTCLSFGFEYYLGTGITDDTLLVVFSPLAPCSLRFVELYMFDAGAMHTFVGLLNPVIADSVVGWNTQGWGELAVGQAPPRGATDVSPIDNASGI